MTVGLVPLEVCVVFVEAFVVSVVIFVKCVAKVVIWISGARGLGVRRILFEVLVRFVVVAVAVQKSIESKQLLVLVRSLGLTVTST